MTQRCSQEFFKKNIFLLSDFKWYYSKEAHEYLLKHEVGE